MKKSKIYILLIIPFLAACVSQKAKLAQEKAVSEALQNNKIQFVAQQAIPMRMKSIQLIDSYGITISKDSLHCNLPYYGVAQNAPYGASDSGLNFNTTHFTLHKSEQKNGNYIINLQIEGQPMINKMSLNISPSGSTTLTVNSVNRDPISFFGDLKL